MSTCCATSPTTLSIGTISPPQVRFLRQTQHFILASGSPRRKRLLLDAGLAFDVVLAPPDVEENIPPGLEAEDEAMRRALAKAGFVAKMNPGAFVLGADTVVVLDGEILGKPSSVEDASRMLGLLSGRTHEVITAFTLLGPETREEEAVKTKVSFREIDEETIGRYAESGEPMDKAGAYAIQGMGGGLVDRVEGSYTNVVGLPVAEVLNAFMRCGVVTDAPLHSAI
ncbi:MAG: septum formation protein Maf [Nitrospinae bacterium]|nr:septum formation protein Maf [Nitrospinota bacterium]